MARLKRPKRPRVFDLDELDGFYIRDELNRVVHITIESASEFSIDIFEGASPYAAQLVTDPIRINIETGAVIQEAGI